MMQKKKLMIGITKQKSDNEAGCSEKKLASKLIDTPVRGTELPISLLGVLSKIKIAEKRKRIFARQKKTLAHYAIEAMI